MKDVYYKIRHYSVKRILLYSINQSMDGSTDQARPLSLNESLSEKSLQSLTKLRENPLFYQMLLELYGPKTLDVSPGDYKKVFEIRKQSLVNNFALSELLTYIAYFNFEDIFDETGLAKESIYQASLIRLFEYGVELVIEGKKIIFKPFEKSGGMSKNKNLSFINHEVIEQVRRRIMMGIDLRQIDKQGKTITFPLSKLFKYNGLMLSDGYRINHFQSDPSEGEQKILRKPDGNPFIFDEKSVLVVRDFTHGKKGNFVTAINIGSLHNKLNDFYKFYEENQNFNQCFIEASPLAGTAHHHNQKSLQFTDEQYQKIDLFNDFYKRYDQEIVKVSQFSEPVEMIRKCVKNNTEIVTILQTQLTNYIFSLLQHQLPIQGATLKQATKDIFTFIDVAYQQHYIKLRKLSKESDKEAFFAVMVKQILLQSWFAMIQQPSVLKTFAEDLKNLDIRFLESMEEQDADRFVNHIITRIPAKTIQQIYEKHVHILQASTSLKTYELHVKDEEQVQTIFKQWLRLFFSQSEFLSVAPESLFSDLFFSGSNLEDWVLIYDQNSVKEVTPFDGLGLISPNLANQINEQYAKITNKKPEPHTSFQIRMPFVKGMLHQVDIQAFFKEHGIIEVEDILKSKRQVKDIEIILTESQFKAYKWLKKQVDYLSVQEKEALSIDINFPKQRDNTQTKGLDIIRYYFSFFNRYHHCLYVTGSNYVPTKNNGTTKVNYQFLSTLEMNRNEFQFLVRESQAHLQELATSVEKQLNLFSVTPEKEYENQSNEENPVPLNENKPLNYYGKIGQLAALSPNILQLSGVKEIISQAKDDARDEFSLGRLDIDGENRYLSGDLLFFLYLIIGKQEVFLQNISDHNPKTSFILPASMFYAPRFDRSKPEYFKRGQVYPLLRNPHVTSNEDALLFAWDCDYAENPRVKYLSHLTGLVMVNSFSFIADRLGGADYDGDMVKIIHHPIYINAVKKNYYINEKDQVIKPRENKKLLRLGYSKAPIIIPGDTSAPQKEYTPKNILETIGRTFFNFIGKISNQAFKYADLAYNPQFLMPSLTQTSPENGDVLDKKKRLQIELKKVVQLFVILIGLEIDSEKTGRKPVVPTDDEILKRIQDNLDFDPKPYFSMEDAKAFLNYKETIQASDKINLQERSYSLPEHTLSFTSQTSNVCMLPKFYFSKEAIKQPKINFNLDSLVYFITLFVNGFLDHDRWAKLPPRLTDMILFFAEKHFLTPALDLDNALKLFKGEVKEKVSQALQKARVSDKKLCDQDHVNQFTQRFLEQEIHLFLKTLFKVDAFDGRHQELLPIDQYGETDEETIAEKTEIFTFEKPGLKAINWLQELSDNDKVKFHKLVSLIDAFKDVYTKFNLFSRLGSPEAFLKLDLLIEHIFFDQYNFSRSEELYDFIEVLHGETYQSRLDELLKLVSDLQWHIIDWHNISSEDEQRIQPMLDILHHTSAQDKQEAVSLLKNFSLQGARLLPLLIKKARLMNKNKLAADVLHLSRLDKSEATLMKKLREVSHDPEVIFEKFKLVMTSRNRDIYLYLEQLMQDHNLKPKRFSGKQVSEYIEEYYEVERPHNPLLKLIQKLKELSNKQLIGYSQKNISDALNLIQKILGLKLNSNSIQVIEDIQQDLQATLTILNEPSAANAKTQKQYVQSKTQRWIKACQQTIYADYVELERQQSLTKILALFNLQDETHLYDQIKEKLMSFDLLNIITTYQDLNQGKRISEGLSNEVLNYQKESFIFQEPCFEEETVKEIKVDRVIKEDFSKKFMPIYFKAKQQKAQKDSMKDAFIALNNQTYQLIMELYEHDFQKALAAFYYLTKLNHKVASIRYLIEIFGSNIDAFKTVLVKEDKHHA